MEEQNKNQEPKDNTQGCLQGITLIASIVMIIVAFSVLFQTCS